MCGFRAGGWNACIGILVESTNSILRRFGLCLLYENGDRVANFANASQFVSIAHVCFIDTVAKTT